MSCDGESEAFVSLAWDAHFESVTPITQRENAREENLLLKPKFACEKRLWLVRKVDSLSCRKWKKLHFASVMSLGQRGTSFLCLALLSNVKEVTTSEISLGLELLGRLRAFFKSVFRTLFNEKCRIWWDLFYLKKEQLLVVFFYWFWGLELNKSCRQFLMWISHSGSLLIFSRTFGSF